jgi:hypothetical protein
MLDLHDEDTIAAYLRQRSMDIVVTRGANLLNNYIQGRPLPL